MKKTGTKHSQKEFKRSPFERVEAGVVVTGPGVETKIEEMSITIKLILMSIITLRILALIFIPARLIPYRSTMAEMVVIRTPRSCSRFGKIMGLIYSAPMMATIEVDAALEITVIQFTIKANAGW